MKAELITYLVGEGKDIILKNFVPLKEGIWEMGTGLATCSVCKETPSRTYIDDSQYWRYCPMCGARMVSTDYDQPEWEPNE